MFKYTLAELKELRDLENKSEISSEELESLTTYFRKHKNNFVDIFEKPSIRICGCIGPKNDDPYCRCSMVGNIFKYRFEIAVNMIENNLEMIDRSEEIAKENLEFKLAMQKIFDKKHQND
jgi:hypothetical protein